MSSRRDLFEPDARRISGRRSWLLLHHDQLDDRVVGALLGIVAGLGMMVAVAVSRQPVPGLITAFMAAFYGAAVGMMVRWRTEPGLWLLGWLFAVMMLGIYAMSTWGMNRNPGPMNSWRTIVPALDGAVAMFIMLRTARYLISASVWNYRQTGGRLPLWSRTPRR